MKRHLFTPGPTPVPPQVLAALAEPIVHHRSPDYRPIFRNCLDHLTTVFRTAREPLMFTASGTGAMESAVANIARPGDRVVVVSAGNFGQRWVQIAQAFECDVDVIDYEWGEMPAAEDLAARLRELGGAKAVLVTHSETSTGVVADVRALAAAAAEAGAFSVVDAISSLGAVPLETDEWGIDVVVAGSQKALMTPPGLAFAATSHATDGGRARGYYFDWARNRKAQEKLDAAFTPAVSLVVALDVALGLLLEDGLEAAFDRHVRLGRACREGAKAMGLELFSPDDDRAAVVTAIRVPEDVDAATIVSGMRERSGVTIIGGQGEVKGKIVRIGHIGYVDVHDVTTALSSLELALAIEGAEIERGTAVSAALDAYHEPLTV
jgi:aspartate aminotransferase-like enzyme